MAAVTYGGAEIRLVEKAAAQRAALRRAGSRAAAGGNSVVLYAHSLFVVLVGVGDVLWWQPARRHVSLSVSQSFILCLSLFNVTCTLAAAAARRRLRRRVLWQRRTAAAHMQRHWFAL